MGYLDRELDIKSVVGIKKHLVKTFAEADVDLDCIKVDRGVKVFWAIDNYLHQHLMDGHVIYVIQEDDLQKCIDAIQESLKQRK